MGNIYYERLDYDYKCKINIKVTEVCRLSNLFCKATFMKRRSQSNSGRQVILSAALILDYNGFQACAQFQCSTFIVLSYFFFYLRFLFNNFVIDIHVSNYTKSLACRVKITVINNNCFIYELQLMK